MLYVLLESIDLTLLKSTRSPYKIIGISEDYLGITDWIGCVCSDVKLMDCFLVLANN